MDCRTTQGVLNLLLTCQRPDMTSVHDTGHGGSIGVAYLKPLCVYQCQHLGENTKHPIYMILDIIPPQSCQFIVTIRSPMVENVECICSRRHAETALL